jgi:hypothetical protein
MHQEQAVSTYLRLRGVPKCGFMGHLSKATTELQYLKYDDLSYTNDESPCRSVPVF